MTREYGCPPGQDHPLEKCPKTTLLVRVDIFVVWVVVFRTLRGPTLAAKVLHFFPKLRSHGMQHAALFQ